jgi:hypothetical protein
MMMSEIDTLCKYCGSCHGVVRGGTGPHKYRVDCKECGRFIKWGAALDIENIPPEEMAKKLNEAEWSAITAAKTNDMIAFWKHINIRNKLNERL